MAVLSIYGQKNKEAFADIIDYTKDCEKTSSLLEAMRYGADEKKTRDEADIIYVSGVGCMPETAYEEMLHTKEQFGKTDKRLYYHAIQSFRPDEKVTADEVHKIGIELAKSIWPEYQVLISTHLNKAHLHNHFVINSVSYVDGKKFANRWEDIAAARAENDRICKMHGLGVISDKRYRGKSYRDWLSGNGGHKTLRDHIKEDIDIAVASSMSMSEFYDALRTMGYTIKQGKHIAVHPAGYVNGKGNDGYIRLRSLNDARYSIEGIAARIRDNRNGMYILPHRQSRQAYKVRARQRLPYYEAMYYKYLYQMGKMKKRPSVSPSVVRADAARLRELEEQIKLISGYKIRDASDLDRIYEQKAKAYADCLLQRERCRKRPEGAEAEKSELKEKIIELRKEIKQMEKIKVQVSKMEVTYAQLRLSRQKGEENVFRDTSSGHSNINTRSDGSASNQDQRRSDRDSSKTNV